MNVDIPASWPRLAKLIDPQGGPDKDIELRPFVAGLADGYLLPDIVVDIPGEGPSRPWRTRNDGAFEDDDGTLVL